MIWIGSRHHLIIVSMILLSKLNFYIIPFYERAFVIQKLIGVYENIFQQSNYLFDKFIKNFKMYIFYINLNLQKK